MSNSSVHRLTSLPCRLFLSCSPSGDTRCPSVVFEEVDMPCKDHFIFLTLLIISMTFVISLTQMLVFLFLYVMLGLLLSMLVCSVLLYGCQCWPLSTSLCSRLSAFDMQAQRTITNTKWFNYKTNIEVRALTKRQPMQRYIARSRHRWFDHLLRSPINHPADAIYNFNPRAMGW